MGSGEWEYTGNPLLPQSNIIAIAKTIRTLNLSPAERDAINRVCPVECLVLTEVTTAINRDNVNSG